MAIISKSAKNYLAVALVFMLILVVYYASSAVNSVIDDEPLECNDTSFTIEKMCYNGERTALSNYHQTVDMTILNNQAEINGFAIKFYGSHGASPVMLFKTVKSGSEATISIPYERELSGSIERMEIMPIVNMNQNLYHCSMRHGIVYEEEIAMCS
jgi:hypothetical protein